MTAAPRILVAGIGNIFLGDDAFGVEVVRRLASRPLPDGVRVADYGIRGYDLALALLDDANDVTIMVDAVPRGGPPGTLYVIEPEWEAGDETAPARASPFEAHAIDPVGVLRLVLALGGRPRRVLVVGCEPTPVEPEEDPPMELSEPVEAALDGAVHLVESLVDQVREGRDLGIPGGSPSDPGLEEGVARKFDAT